MYPNQFEKVKYSIGQVSELLGLRQSVLRYWEMVFPGLNPEKTAGGTRRYSHEDIDLLRLIKTLLYDRGFTIKGARAYLENPSQDLPVAKDTVNKPENWRHSLSLIESEIQKIIRDLK